MNSNKFNYGGFVIAGYGQLMQDETWSAKCIVTAHAGPHTDEVILVGHDSYATEQGAANAASHLGMQWVDERHPKS
jgi:hypothetical protein